MLVYQRVIGDPTSESSKSITSLENRPQAPSSAARFVAPTPLTAATPAAFASEFLVLLPISLEI